MVAGWFGQRMAVGTLSRIVRSVWLGFEEMRQKDLSPCAYAALLLEGLSVKKPGQGERVLLVAVG